MGTMLLMLATVAVLAGGCYGLEIGTVMLEAKRTNMYYHLGTRHGNNVVQCPYTLHGDEELELVRWNLQTLNPRLSAPRTGQLTKYSNGQVEVTGMLQGIVAIDRSDYNLEFTNITYDLWANYTCTVSLTNGMEMTASQNIIVTDDSSTSFGRRNIWACGSATFALSVGARFPPPVVDAEVFSDSFNSFGYMVKPNNTNVIYHNNGSASIDNRVYTVMVDRDTPEDAKIRIAVYWVRHNGERMDDSSTAFSIQEKLGCEELEVSTNQTVKYNSEGKNCYGQLKHEDQILEAQVRCAEDFGVDTMVEMVCVLSEENNQYNTKYNWQPKRDGIRPEDLDCRPKSPAPGNSAPAMQLPVAMVVLLTAILTYNQLC